MWYSGVCILVAHMARGERQRSLTVVGGARGEVARYASLLPESGGPVLLLGVAEGMLAEALVRRGISITGVDPSQRMLARAEETRAELPPEAQGRLHLLRADLRSLRLSERFVGVFAPRDAVALVATRGDLEALFVTAREHLAPGASFAFDLSLPPPRWLFPEDVDPHEGVQPERADAIIRARLDRDRASRPSTFRQAALRQHERRESNPQPPVLETGALPIELRT